MTRSVNLKRCSSLNKAFRVVDSGVYATEEDRAVVLSEREAVKELIEIVLENISNNNMPIPVVHVLRAVYIEGRTLSAVSGDFKRFGYGSEGYTNKLHAMGVELLKERVGQVLDEQRKATVIQFPAPEQA